MAAKLEKLSSSLNYVLAGMGSDQLSFPRHDSIITRSEGREKPKTEKYFKNTVPYFFLVERKIFEAKGWAITAHF